MKDVLFADAHVKKLERNSSLPAKFERMLDKAGFEERFKGKRVAIKMHVGGDIGFYTIHPIFVKILVDAVKKAGGKPFLTDGSFSTDAAIVRGYTPEVVGARVVGAGGEHDRYHYTRSTPLPGLENIEICGNIVDADAMIVFSHGKGHGHTGYGGAIKNIGMGCVSYHTRGKIHGLSGKHFEWDGDTCTHCGQCISGCPTGAIQFNSKNEIGIDIHYCRFCMHCVISCATGALKMDQPAEKFKLFQAGMAQVVKSVIETFEQNRVYYITTLMNITPLCDCWGFSTQPIVPDIGITASDDIVALEQASIDLIDADKLIPGTLPDQFGEPEREGHLFQRIHGKDPYVQVRECEALGLGTSDYKLVEIE